LHRADSITFTWSEGAAHFEPYHLEGADRANLLNLAAEFDAKIATATSPEFAQLGRRLYRALFAGAAAVEAWVGALARGNTIERLDVYSDEPGLVPWNCIVEDPAADNRCWGARFPITQSRRVNALRANPTLTGAKQLYAVDLETSAHLTQDQQLFLAPRDGGKLVHTTEALADSIKNGVPDILLLLVRFSSGRLWLGDDSFTATELRAWLDEPREGNPDPMVVLVGAGAQGDQPAWRTFLADATAVFNGLIANETLLPATQTFAVGQSIAQRLAEGQKNLGDILLALRQEMGAAALAFSAFCPATIRVATEVSTDAVQPDVVIAPLPLPLRPYRPFAAFDDVDRPLFIGREDDAIRAALALDHADAQGLFLHGDPAAGKTSFLQAGLIPFLEQEAVGYRVLRDRSPTNEAVAESEYPILVLRCTSDLAGQFADALGVFCAQPMTFTTPVGKQVTLDLPGILLKALNATAGTSDSTAIQASPTPPSDDAHEPVQGTDVRSLWVRLRDNKEVLGDLLDRITRALPFELVIAVDQGEELVTQVKSAQQQARRQKALEMLAQVARAAPRCKLLFTIRSQALGPLLSLFPGGGPAGWHTHFLRSLTETEMADALLWPTDREPIPYSDEIPYQKYGFAFEEGLAQQIVADAVDAMGPEQQSPLPLIQATAALLYEKQVLEKKQSALRAADLKDLGGVKAALGKCLDGALDRLKLASATRHALRELIARLHTDHADGSVSRDLVHASDLKNNWAANADPVEPVVNTAASSEGLFDIQQLYIGGQSGLYVSLPQDSLARLGQKINTEREKSAFARTKVVDVLWIMIPLIFAAAVGSWWLTRNNYLGGAVENDDARKKLEVAVDHISKLEKERRDFQIATRRSRYYGQLALAEQALRLGNARRAREILLSQPAMLAYIESRAEDPDQRPRDLRGFEWRYLWRYLNSERHLFVGHQGVVNAIAVSADSRWAASASGDGTVRVWNLVKGEAAALLVGPKAAVNAIAFSPDGKTLASGGSDKLIRLWDLSQLDKDFATLKDAKTLDGHTDAVHALAFGKDADSLASGGADRSIIVWDKRAKKHTLSEHKDTVRALMYDSSGATLYSAGVDGTLVAWDAAAGTKRHGGRAPHKILAAISLSSDGKTLATAGTDVKLDAESGTIRFFAIGDFKESAAPIAHGLGVLSLAFRPDGKAIASGGADHVIRLWDLEKRNQIHQWIGHLGGIRALAFAKDGNTLLSGDFEGVIKAWNPTQSSGPDVVAAHTDWVQALALNHQSTLLASGARDGSVKLWDPKDGKLIRELAKHAGSVTAIAFSTHQKKQLLAVATRNEQNAGEIKIWQLDHDEKKGWQETSRHSLSSTKGVTCLAFHPDVYKADWLLSGGADGAVRHWDADKGKETQVWQGHKDEVRCLAILSDGRSFVSGGKDALLCYHEFENKKVWPCPGLHLSSIEAAASTFAASRDDRGIQSGVITGSADHTMRIWRIERDADSKIDAKDPVRHYRSHVQPVSGIHYSEGVFVSAGWDGMIKLFDGAERFTLSGHEGPVRAVVVGADQAFIASAGHDGTIRFWRTHQERMVNPK
jgi:WD40 repeat protein